MFNCGNRARIGLIILLMLLIISFQTISTTPSTFSIDHSKSPQDDTAQLSSFADSSTIFNSSTLGSVDDIYIDSAGYLYATGSAKSSSFPIVDGLDNTLNGTTDCFVMKMNTTDGSILYSSYLGGNGTEYSISICVDDSGCIYVLGLSNSEDFPVVNPYSDYYNQSSQYFLTKFASDGQSLVYSTFFGAEFVDGLNSADFRALAVDELGNAYLTGTTINSTVPIVNSFDESHNGDYDCYILKLNPTGSEIVYASFYGTEYPDKGYDLFYAGDGIIYLTGTTSICPTDGYYHSPGPDYGGHCFVLKISDNGTLLDTGQVKSTDFFPQTAIVVDSQNSVYILDEPHTTDSFAVYKFGSELNLEYVKTFSWDKFTLAQAITIDSEGFIYIAGRSYAAALAQSPSSSYSGEDDCFIIRMSSGGDIVFSSLYGTPLRENTNAITVDENGHVYLAGTTTESIPFSPLYYCSFIISVQVPSVNILNLLLPELLLAGSIGIAAMVIFVIVYRKRRV